MFQELNSPYDACVVASADLTLLECLEDSDCGRGTCHRGQCLSPVWHVAVRHVRTRETGNTPLPPPSVSRTNISFMEFLQKMLLIRNVIPTIKTLEVLHIYRAISEEVHQMQPVKIIPTLYTQHSRCYIIYTRCCLFLILVFLLFYINYHVEVPLTGGHFKLTVISLLKPSNYIFAPVACCPQTSEPRHILILLTLGCCPSKHLFKVVFIVFFRPWVGNIVMWWWC